MDLYHDLNDLVAKAGKHDAMELGDIDDVELDGQSDKDIEEELKE